MRIPFLIISISVFLAGCGSRDKVPPRLIQPRQMQAIVWDLMRADQFLTEYLLNKDSTLNNLDESTRMYRQVLAIHKVSKEHFRESFSYYQSHPAIMKVLMDSISKMATTVPVPTTVEPKLVEDSVGKSPKKVIDTIGTTPGRKRKIVD